MYCTIKIELLQVTKELKDRTCDYCGDFLQNTYGPNPIYMKMKNFIFCQKCTPMFARYVCSLTATGKELTFDKMKKYVSQYYRRVH